MLYMREYLISQKILIPIYNVYYLLYHSIDIRCMQRCAQFVQNETR